MKCAKLLMLLIGLTGVARAQQDAQVSLYMRNPVQFNPAHAGLDGALQATAISRIQWVGWDGAPSTHLFSAHAPLANDALGLGISAMNDVSGARHQQEVMGQIAVRIIRSPNGPNLSAGLALGVEAAGFDFSDLNVADAGDPGAVPVQQMGFAAGFGVLLNREDWYVSVSVPQLLERDLGSAVPMSRSDRHLYLSGGMARQIRPHIELKSAFLAKAVAHAPPVLDLNVECWVFDAIAIGVMARLTEGMGVQAAFRIAESMRLHYAVDFPTNGMMSRTFGSHEVGIAWGFGPQNKPLQSPRHFL